MVKLNIELPEGFLEEEEREGYTVTSEMKKVWAVELDLLAKLLEVCKKHDIKIFASGGTMLGAVRHKGFIPWDDDIDMMMFREDYEKLCEIAPEEFKHPYFFQTDYTDPGSMRRHAQLRNSETTAILKGEMGKYSFNQGIFLDIFPLDNVIDDEELYEKQRATAFGYLEESRKWAKYTSRYGAKWENPKGHTKEKIVHYLFCWLIKKMKLQHKWYKKFEIECQRYNDRPTKLVSTLSFFFNKREHWKYREDYEELVDMPFEFMTIPVGKNYDHGLWARYGDYKTIVKGSSCHGGVFFDVENSYKKYVKEGRKK